MAMLYICMYYIAKNNLEHYTLDNHVNSNGLAGVQSKNRVSKLLTAVVTHPFLSQGIKIANNDF